MDPNELYRRSLVDAELRRGRGGPRLAVPDVLSIRKDKRPTAVIAEEHGISVSSVRNIKNGRTYTGVLSDVRTHKNPVGRKPSLSEEKRREIRESQLSVRELAKKYDVSASLIYSVKQGTGNQKPLNPMGLGAPMKVKQAWVGGKLLKF